MRSLATAILCASTALSLSCKTPEATNQGSETKDWLVTAGDWIIKGTLNYSPHLDYKKIKLKVDIHFFKSSLTITGESTTGEMSIKGVIEPTGEGTADVTFDFTPVSERYMLPSFTMEGARHHLQAAYHGQGDIAVGRAYAYANPPSGTATNARFIEQLTAIRAELSHLSFLEMPEIALPFTGAFKTPDGAATIKFADLNNDWSPTGPAIVGKYGHSFTLESDDSLRTCSASAGYKAYEVSGGIYKAKPMKMVCAHGPFSMNKVKVQVSLEGRVRASNGQGRTQCVSFKGAAADVAAEMKVSAAFKETWKIGESHPDNCTYKY
jgi:hypothetical protein